MLRQIMLQQEAEENARRAKGGAEAKLKKAANLVASLMQEAKFEEERTQAVVHCLRSGQLLPEMHDGEWLEKKSMWQWIGGSLARPPRYPARDGRPVYCKVKAVDFVYRYLGREAALMVVELCLDLWKLGCLGEASLGDAGWNGRTLLCDAAAEGMCDQIDLLIKAGASTTYSGPQTRRPNPAHPPLIAACLGGHIDAVERLLNAGADPNVFSPDLPEYACTPLHAALSASRHVEGILDRLVVCGADFDFAAGVGTKPFYRYAKAPDLLKLRTLGVSMDLQGPRGTLLQILEREFRDLDPDVLLDELDERLLTLETLRSLGASDEGVDWDSIDRATLLLLARRDNEA